jgi:hypothetical protein
MIRFAVILETSKPPGAATRALRAFLKCAWRAWGLRCTEAKEVTDDAKPENAASEAAEILPPGERDASQDRPRRQASRRQTQRAEVSTAESH